jgi:hypothetical protein
MRKTIKAARGETIQVDYGRDNSSHTAIDGTKNGKMGGSVANLDHSLKGSVPAMDGPDRGKKNRFS